MQQDGRAKQLAEEELVVVAQRAKAEGLTLVRSSTSTGFRGVTHNRGSKTNPFKAEIRVDGAIKSLGAHTSAALAALAYARYLGPERCAAAVAEPAPAPSKMSEVEAEELAARGTSRT